MNYNHNEYEDETFIIIVIRACYNMHAQAPGRDVTVMPAWYACFTISSPGSEIPGVPASVTSAIFVPFNIFSTRYLALSILLYS